MKLDQYFTPTWAAELLFKRHFSDLSGSDIVLDPSCGDGRFLLAVPDHIQAFGVEIDPAAADQARHNSGREVITGDFRSVSLPADPSAIIGNPPFQYELIMQFVDRCYELLEYGARAGFILPVYVFQTASTMTRLQKQWSVSQELIPRNLFAGLAKPILFATLEKSQRPTLSGFFLYAETDAISDMHKEFQQMFVGNNSRPNVWRDAVARALDVCGGHATLQQLYAAIEGNRPTRNPWWREKVRQIAGQYFHRVKPGEYKFREAA